MQLIIPAEAAHDTVYQLGEVRSPCVAVRARALSHCGPHRSRCAHAVATRLPPPHLDASRRGQLRSRSLHWSRTTNGGPTLGALASALTRARCSSALRRPA